MVYAQKIVSGYRYSLQGNDMMRKREKWQGRDQEHQRAYARRNYLLCAEWAPFTILSAGLQAWNVKQAPQWNVLLVALGVPSATAITPSNSARKAIPKGRRLGLVHAQRAPRNVHGMGGAACQHCATMEWTSCSTRDTIVCCDRTTPRVRQKRKFRAVTHLILN